MTPSRPVLARPSRRALAVARASGRRWFQYALTFVALLLIVNALVGERGLLQTRRARVENQQLEASLGALRRQNARLREEARRLKEDPRAVEEAARQELGLMRRDELVFIIKDRGPAGRTASGRQSNQP